VGGEISLRPYNPHGGISGGVARLVLLRDGQREVRPVRSFRAVSGGYLIRFAGFDDRESVSVLTHAEVRIERTALPALGPGEYYVEDVIGCAVEDEGGRALGVAREIFWNGAHDVASVVDGAGVERLIPLVPEVVLTDDMPGRKIRVRWDADD
jgi:16S rRNA processing protein RimM